MKIFLGNKIERLYEELQQSLFAAPTTPFTTRYIIVPSPAMRSWLMRRFAEDPMIQVCTGVQITYIEHALSGLIADLSADSKSVPSPISSLERSMRLEIEIRKKLDHFRNMGAEERVIWEPLISYVQSDSSSAARRVVSLATKLARLFDRYEVYGQRMLQLWKKEPPLPGEWQKALWKCCSERIYPGHMAWRARDYTIHLFGQSFLPRLHYDLFKGLSSSNPVTGYFLSPCQFFWSEILSDKQCWGVLHRLEKEGVREAQQWALEEYIYDRNPLLANLGRIGREMALLLEKDSLPPQERYEVASSFHSMPFYQEAIGETFHLAPHASSPTLLECIQTDLLLMRRPRLEEIIHLPETDRSVQIHEASSALREVQGLYDTLLTLIDRHAHDSPPLLPREIIVMAPDIVRYEPYIHAVFSRTTSVLDYQILDLNLLSRYPLIQGFLSLIALSQSKWDVSSVLDLFENPIFQRKQHLTLEELQLFKRWIETADIRWGLDPAQRREILERKYAQTLPEKNYATGTWGWGFGRLLLGMIMRPCEREDSFFNEHPLEEIESTQAELLGRYIQLLDTLRRDLEPLADGSILTPGDWSLYLKNLLGVYFCDLESSIEAEEARGPLLEILEKFCLDHKFPGEKFAFSSIRTHLETLLNQKIFGYRESHLHAVRFCSLLPMRALPAQVIVLLGMDEESYPRKEMRDSLDLLKNSPASDYCPSQSDFDRYIFLEVLLSSRKYLLFFYTGYSREDGKKQNVSILVSELISYLDTGFTIGTKKPSKACFKEHPFASYDKKLFEENSEIPSYDPLFYRAARVIAERQNSSKIEGRHSLFVHQKSPSLEIPGCLDLKSLGAVARNPVETYFKKRLGIYLKEFKGLEKRNEEDFVLEALESFMLKQQGLKKPAKQLLDLAEKKGILPSGPFRMFSLSKIEQEIERIQQHLKNLGINSNEIFDVHFSENIESPMRGKEGNWLLPALECSVAGQRVRLIGKLTRLCPQGWISLQSEDKVQQIKAWPHYLAFLAAYQKYPVLGEQEWIFAKTGKSKKSFLKDPFTLLEKYLEYHHLALQQVSPLIPEWTLEFLKGDASGLEKKMEACLSEKDQYFFNPYLKWALQNTVRPNPCLLIETWSPIATELFSDLS